MATGSRTRRGASRKRNARHPHRERSIRQRVGRASRRTWAWVLAPALTIVVGAAANAWLVPLVQRPPARHATASIQDVRQDSHGALAIVLSRAERARPGVSRLLRCDGAIFAVRVRARGFTSADPPRVRWTLVNHATQLAWPVPPGLAVVRDYVLNAGGGSRRVWIPLPPLSGDWDVRIDVYGGGRDVDDPFDTKPGDRSIPVAASAATDRRCRG